MGFVNNDKDVKSPGQRAEVNEPSAEIEDLYRKLQPEMRRPKPSADAIAAAMEAAQRLAAEADAEEAADDISDDAVRTASSTPLTPPPALTCAVCGHQNRKEMKFCGMCGVAMVAAEEPGLAILPVEPPASARAGAKPGEIEPERHG